MSKKQSLGKSSAARRAVPATKARPPVEGDVHELRRAPTQARAVATFERILDVTAGLLEEIGSEAVTTNHIARAATINVATLYQYFPNKETVLIELFRRQAERRSALAGEILAKLSARAGWREVVVEALDALATLRRRERGATPLRQAMRSVPSLQSYDRDDARRTARMVAERISAVTGMPRADATLVARSAIEAFGAMLDGWMIESRGRDQKVLEQARQMVLRYLEPVFDAGGKGARAARR